MRIAIVNSHYYPDEVGGAERSLRFLAEAAVGRGHACTVFALGKHRERFETGGVRIERFPCPGVETASRSPPAKLLWHVRDTWSAARAAEIAAAIGRFRPDVVHTNNLSGISVAIWSRLARMGLPIVHTLRDYYLMCPNTARFRGGEPCTRTCGACRVLSVPRLTETRHVACVIGNSRFILDAHLRAGAFARARSDVIYNSYRPAGPSRQRQPVGRDRPLKIGYIGRLVPTKGLERLIAAFRSVSQTLERRVQLSIAGTGTPAYRMHLQDLAQGLAVTFHGQMRPQEFYESVDLTVVPSVWDEPLSRVLFESFAHGVPVLASRRGGSPELVSEGKTGWLCDIDAANAFETALTMAIQTCGSADYTRMSHRCLEASERFVPERTLKSYLTVMRETAAGRSLQARLASS